MKKILIIAISIWLCGFVIAQSPVVLSNLFISYRHIDEGNQYHQMPSFGTPEHSNRKSELNVNFNISNYSQLREVEIMYGTKEGAQNILYMKLLYEEKKGEQFLTHNNKSFQIIDQNVNITILIPESIVTNTSYTTIKAIDKSGQFTNVLTKKMN